MTFIASIGIVGSLLLLLLLLLLLWKRTEEKPAGKEVTGAAGDAAGNSTVAPAQCSGDWKFPVSCDPAGNDCLYHAMWKYIQRTDEIRFTITANYTDKWVAIGFSQSTFMVALLNVSSIVSSSNRLDYFYFGSLTASNGRDPGLDRSHRPRLRR